MLIKIDPGRRGHVQSDDSLGMAVESASAGAASAEELTKLLLEGTLFVLQHAEAQLTPGDVAAGRLSLGVYQEQGRNFVEVYSSAFAVEHLAPEGSRYAGIPGDALLRMWSAEDWFILNPRNRHRLLLSPAEVVQIAKGELGAPLQLEVVI